MIEFRSEKRIIDDSNPKETIYLTLKSNLSQRRTTEKFQKITEDLNKSFASRNQQSKKDSLNKSKVDRRDTQESDSEKFKFFTEKQIERKNQQITELIQKSQTDPFMKRKLKALMENESKSLRKMKDKSGNTLTQCSSKSSLFNNPEDKFIQHQYALQTEFIRNSNTIGKILKNGTPKHQNFSIKRVNSQTYIERFGSNRFLHQLTLPENTGGEFKMQRNFTTLKQTEYKKKIQNLEMLRQIMN